MCAIAVGSFRRCTVYAKANRLPSEYVIVFVFKRAARSTHLLPSLLIQVVARVPGCIRRSPRAVSPLSLAPPLETRSFVVIYGSQTNRNRNAKKNSMQLHLECFVLFYLFHIISSGGIGQSLLLNTKFDLLLYRFPKTR